MQEFLIPALVVFVLLSLYLVFKLNRLNINLHFLHTQMNECKKELETKTSQIQSLENERANLKEEKIRLQAEQQALLQRINFSEKQMQEQRVYFEKEKQSLKLETSEAQSKLEQKYQANLNELKKNFDENLLKQNSSILTQNKALFYDEGKKMLDEIFKPVQKSVEEYKQKLLQNETALQTNIKNMFEYSQKIGEKAEQLATILKGDKKIRGNFAELQLKNVLENSGLKEGQHYELQEHFKQEGKSYYPDAVVKLDQHKNIIIDAKFSLPNDFDFTSNNANLCGQLALNLKARIDELAKKPYANFNAHTYDFVLLFIPYQNILDLALEAQPNLYQEAYKKSIYLTTPQTLFMALKTIEITWIHIRSNENIITCFKEIGGFYDKFAAFVDDVEKINANLNTLETNVTNLRIKLSGKGGLISRFEKLKSLGAKTNKQINTDLIEPQSLFDTQENIQSLTKNED